MIATLILLLEEEGKLFIDDALDQYIVPSVNVGGGITIKQLLNHTSGLSSFTDHPDYYPFINNNLEYLFACGLSTCLFCRGTAFCSRQKNGVLQYRLLIAR